MFNLLLPVGWHALGQFQGAIKKKYSWAQIVQTDSGSSQLLSEIPTVEEVAEMDREQRRHYYKILKRWLDNLEDPAAVLGDVMERPWFRRWSNEYEFLEKRIEDLNRYTDILEADPGILVDYAMGGYAPLV